MQYVLDNYATVSEAADDLSQEKFAVVSSLMPAGSRFATLNLAISDAPGDRAIFEYLGGKLTVHHDRSYQVMTNSPVFDPVSETHLQFRQSSSRRVPNAKSHRRESRRSK